MRIAGVMNIILKDDVDQGWRNTTYGITSAGDGGMLGSRYNGSSWFQWFHLITPSTFRNHSWQIALNSRDSP
jgi:hypothetical protein